MAYFTTRKPAVSLVCSDCGRAASLSQRELKAAKRPRCVACGGPLNRPEKPKAEQPLGGKPFSNE